MNTHLALTIGPIYPTFSQAKRTRAVWAASYFFSWFIKRLTEETKKNSFDILLPYSNKIYKSHHGSGLYADRIYFSPNGKKRADLQKIVDTVIAEIAAGMGDDTTAKEKAEKFLKQYLSIHIIETEIKGGDELLETLNRLLDQKELTQNYAFDNDPNYLLDYLDTKLKNGGTLIDDAFDNANKPKDDKIHRFRSIPEIAATDLRRRNKSEFDKMVAALYKADKYNIDLEFYDEAIATNSELRKIVRPYHKYYAIMYADGDNISKLLTADGVKGKPEALQKFSKLLLDFGQQAEQIIHNFGGSGVYLGGEDILAFLPIACIDQSGDDKKVETQNLFTLVQQLDICFANTIGKYAIAQAVKEPTLSYGIMLSYFKHPLKESRDMAHKLMDDVAKKTLCKNSIGFRFQKHSGQYMQCCIEKSKTSSWKKITELTKAYTKNVHEEKISKKNEELLSGVIHRFKDDTFWEVFKAAARAKRLEPMFANFFDESAHAPQVKQDFLKAVRELAEVVFHDYPDDEACRQVIFTVLRYIHFINSERE